MTTNELEPIDAFRALPRNTPLVTYTGEKVYFFSVGKHQDVITTIAPVVGRGICYGIRHYHPSKVRIAK